MRTGDDAVDAPGLAAAELPVDRVLDVAELPAVRVPDVAELPAVRAPDVAELPAFEAVHDAAKHAVLAAYSDLRRAVVPGCADDDAGRRWHSADATRHAAGRGRLGLHRLVHRGDRGFGLALLLAGLALLRIPAARRRLLGD